MKVIDHEPHAWFLLEESGRRYFDARVTRSAADWTVFIEMSPQECREYHAMGRLFLKYLAARIPNFVEEYAARDLTRQMEGEVLRAVTTWKAGNV